ncbi:glycosyltransferase family 2 protein [Algoriphagus sp. PAP.12]|uniref:glycosyltransferase family 2 protein n=1 Tax=Algoriphagus sp. PAP.12 TaxID=2996678 RepID=UPI00227C9568|nr:glycosyltransferase [Algoriphagus sp. PAP.12]
MISIVIPVYKDWTRLKKCLETISIQRDFHSQLEVLVVNNLPEDPLPEFPDYGFYLSILTEKKPGSYAARNKALEHACGTWVLFTDSDCIPDLLWLKRADFLTHSGIAELYAGNILVKSISNSRFSKFDQAFAFPNKKYVEKESFGVTANLLVKKEVFEKVGQFNSQLMTGGDSEFCNRAVRGGFRIVYDENLKVEHPARESWNQLKTKAVRFGGRLPSGSGKGLIFLKLIGKFRVRVDDIQQISGLENVTIGQKLDFMWIKQQLRWVEAVESMKVFFGKSAGRL